MCKSKKKRCHRDILLTFRLVILSPEDVILDVILNREKDYHEDDKERLRKQARDKYRNLSEEQKNKKREYGRKRFHNMSKGGKQKLKEYQKNYHETKKFESNNQSN